MRPGSSNPWISQTHALSFGFEYTDRVAESPALQEPFRDLQGITVLAQVCLQSQAAASAGSWTGTPTQTGSRPGKCKKACFRLPSARFASLARSLIVDLARYAPQSCTYGDWRATRGTACLEISGEPLGTAGTNDP